MFFYSFFVIIKLVNLMKKVLLFLIIFILLTGCSKDNKKEDIFKVGYATNYVKEEDYTQFKELFENSRISNSELFFSWVLDFNKEEDMGCGIKDWNDITNFKYNEAYCIERFEKNHKVSDGNCRITAFTLMQDTIKVDKPKKDYGSYLMFDIDVLDNNENYKMVSVDRDRFITVFDEMDVSEVSKDELKKVLPKKWEEYGIKINSENVSLISVVTYDEDFKTLFVGHAGVLIKLGDKYLFVEKIAFEQPYQFSVIQNVDALKEIFSKRESYFGGGVGPFVYQNDKLIFEY